MSSSFPLCPSSAMRRTVLAAALAVAGLSSTAAPSARAQDRVVGPPRGNLPIAVVPERMPTLGCCHCLGGENTLDLGTVPGNPWRVNGQPAVPVASPNVAWSTQTHGARWVSLTTGANGGSNTNDHYTLQFRVEKCTIPQSIVLKGVAAAGDNFVKVYLTGPVGAGPVQCTVAGGYCFTASNQLNNFAAWPVTAPGVYTLNVDVRNLGGPTGMFISAVLEGRCTKEPVKPDKGAQAP